ncbi:MAG: hypothetical protein ACRDG8_02230 [Actinomycetota bacterium]
MTNNAETVLVHADMSAFDFHEAAWEALERHAPPPDPTTLSDRALYVVMRYEERDLPSEALDALEDECRRRGIISTLVERLLAVGLMALLAISGVVIAWMLFAG